MTETGTELSTFAPDHPIEVFQNAEKVDELLRKISEVVDAHVPDLTTVKGRDAIKSLAYKVARTKTALDEAGKGLNETARKQIDAVDESRRNIRAALDALRDRARKPLDDWEAAEARRKDEVAEKLRFITNVVMLCSAADASSSYIDAELIALNKMEFDADIFGDDLGIAVAKKTSAMSTLGELYRRAVKAEADAAELAKLRAEQQEREAQEFARAEEKRLADEAEAARKADEDRAKAAEEKRLADIKAAEDRAAKEASDKVAAAAQAKIDAANAETARLKKIEDDRIAAEKQAADEQAAREADRAHRGKLMGEAKTAIMAHSGATEEVAKKIVLAIVAGEIPNVTLRF